MKRLLLFFILVLIGFPTIAQNYTEWDEHDVVRFYEKIELDSYTLDAEGEEIAEIYVPTKIEEGLYEVEVMKVSSKLYQIRGTNIYMLFQFSPFMFNFDEGILDANITYESFYQKP